MDDLISRQAAIEVIKSETICVEYTTEMNVHEVAYKVLKSTKESIIEMVKELPSAQPEIVRCKDCKWWDRKGDQSSYGYCHAIKHRYYSPRWEISIYRTYDKDFFCADAERKTECGAEMRGEE